jgi:hypothetical protein
MKLLCLILLGLLGAETAFGVQPVEDPVLKARAQRAAAQGIAEADLPPVPKGIAEPPPLPPPEIHPRDTRGYRNARLSRRGRRAKASKGKRVAPKARKAAPKARRR